MIRVTEAAICTLVALVSARGYAQLIDKHRMPNTANEGINKSLVEEIGQGRGFETMPDSSMCIIKRDPFRAVRRGRGARTPVADADEVFRREHEGFGI